MGSEYAGNDSPQFMVLYENVIEIGFSNEKHCNGKPSCMITYDYDGKKIGEAKPFHLKGLQFDRTKLVIPVSYQNQGKGYYIIEQNYPTNDLHAVFYVDSSGEDKRQISNYSDDFGPMAFACAYGHYTYCKRDMDEDKTVHCAQYDTKELRMNITLKGMS